MGRIIDDNGMEGRFGRFRRNRGMSGDELEGMGKKFKVKVKSKTISKKVKQVKKVANNKVVKLATRASAAYATGGASEAALLKSKALKSGLNLAKGVKAKKGGGGEGEVVDEVSTVQSAPSQPSVITQYVDRVVDAMPDALTEEVEEMNEATGKVEKVKKVKPLVKYGVSALGIGAIALIVLKLKKRR